MSMQQKVCQYKHKCICVLYEEVNAGKVYVNTNISALCSSIQAPSSTQNSVNLCYLCLTKPASQSPHANPLSQTLASAFEYNRVFHMNLSLVTNVQGQNQILKIFNPCTFAVRSYADHQQGNNLGEAALFIYHFLI